MKVHRAERSSTVRAFTSDSAFFCTGTGQEGKRRGEIIIIIIIIIILILIIKLHCADSAAVPVIMCL